MIGSIDRRIATALLSALRLEQADQIKAYLPDKRIVAQALKRAVEKNRGLAREFKDKLCFVEGDFGIESPEVNEMIEEGYFGGLIDYWTYDNGSERGYRFIIQHRGANHLLREERIGESRRLLTELASKAHDNYIPLLEEKLKFYEGKSHLSTWTEPLHIALGILRDPKRMRVA